MKAIIAALKSVQNSLANPPELNTYVQQAEAEVDALYARIEALEAAQTPAPAPAVEAPAPQPATDPAASADPAPAATDTKTTA
jgi:lysozyme family protein